MKCLLLGKQNVNFEDQKGQPVIGTKLHLVSCNEESSMEMLGRRCSPEFVKFNVDDLMVPSVVNLIYEPLLGSKRMRLVKVEATDEEVSL